MATLEELDAQTLPGDDELDQEILNLSTQELQTRAKLLDNEIRIFRSELQRLSHENNVMLEKIKDNKEKIKNNRQLPYLVANVVEVMDMNEIEDKENSESTTQGGNVNLDNTAVGKAAVVKTSSRPVSYTHLDVYKRQGSNPSPPYVNWTIPLAEVLTVLSY